MDNLGENRQLINILFCGYRRSEIGDWRLEIDAETYTRPGHRVPQRVIRTSYPPRSPHHGWGRSMYWRFHALSPFALVLR